MAVPSALVVGAFHVNVWIFAVGLVALAGVLAGAPLLLIAAPLARELLVPAPPPPQPATAKRRTNTGEKIRAFPPLGPNERALAARVLTVAPENLFRLLIDMFAPLYLRQVFIE